VIRLARVDLQNSKSCDTPSLPRHYLLKDDGQPYSHYLLKDDIDFFVNHACQFMHNPMHSHVVAVQRILGYLKGTLDIGLHFSLVFLLCRLIVMLTGPVIPMIDVLSLALLSSSALVLFLGLLRNNVLFLDHLLRLSIKL